jgi:transcriptional regulator with XRE-family HTH domain
VRTKIKQQRKKLGYTQEEMALKLGYTRAKYNRFEQGETVFTSLKDVEKLLEMLEISLFLTENDQKSTN